MSAASKAHRPDRQHELLLSAWGIGLFRASEPVDASSDPDLQ